MIFGPSDAEFQVESGYQKVPTPKIPFLSTQWFNVGNWSLSLHFLKQVKLRFYKRLLQ